MIDISNLRMESHGEWTRLVADITSDFQRLDSEDTIWVAVKNENADMLTTDSYNMFLLYPLYMAMYYRSDMHLHGKVSEKLYSNVNTYLQPIMCFFSDDLKRVNVIVDGFGEAEGTHHLVGTGISGGVDCLSTIYTHYEKEQVDENKINALFMMNFACMKRDDTRDLYYARCRDMKRIADALHLPFYEVDSNLESFLPLGDRCSYFTLYSCVFALEKAIGKYYISSSLSYAEMMQWHNNSHNRDWSEYAEPYAIPLMESNNLKLISDGCQYTRSEKTELISDWEIARKYLYVCSAKKTVANCGNCVKCRRTLLPLDAMGKLEAFSDVFDIEKYRKQAKSFKCNMVLANGKEVFATDNYQFCKRKGMDIPSWFVARCYTIPDVIRRRIKKKGS